MGCVSSTRTLNGDLPYYTKSDEKLHLPAVSPTKYENIFRSEPEVTLPPPPAPSPSLSYPLSPSIPRVFKMKDIRDATENFSESLVLGEGGFGKVYKGFLSNENGETVKVAIKRLNPESHQGQKEWLNEILTLGRFSHPNLVKFHGYCPVEGILVYEYIPFGSLDYHLFPIDDSNDNSSLLSWENRIKIAHGIASGLAFLHENNVIHRDLKTPNILLDANYKPLITDFGLAKIAEANATHASTRIMGTMGYLDPGYVEKGQLTKKSDVYSFGVMLLELISGRRAMIDNIHITSWASKYWKASGLDVENILDPLILPSLSSKKMLKIAQKLINTARQCVEYNRNLRPEMDEIVNTLSLLLGMVQNVERLNNGD